MPDAAASTAVAAAIADAHRREWAFVLAATVRVTRDIDLAEECVQDAYAQALTTWATDGIPKRPGGWLTTVARRRALDRLRREAVFHRLLPLVIEDQEPVGAAPATYFPPAIPDDRLRLICTCCHPALARDAQVALTLRLLCGLTTAEVARAFLTTEATMAARITRAKKKISAARIPYRVPSPAELPDRIGGVLAVVHLLFTTGHTAPSGSDLVRADLVGRAIDLARMLRQLLPANGEVAAVLALTLLTDARRTTRVDAEGNLTRLADQDRTQWDRAEITEGVALVEFAARRRPPGRYTIEAAIAAVHAQAASYADTDWVEIVGLYDRLLTGWPSPVIALNRAVALGQARGPVDGLAAVEELGRDPRLATYPYLAATRADFLRRLGRTSEARTAYQEALLLTENDVEREFLAGRLDSL
jgi:RNA polymerase sigma-70 factor (ECF subfamily)